MQPIRQVYPMSGFQLLIDAYCKAVNSSEAIHAETFIKEYAQQRYGCRKTKRKPFSTISCFPKS